MTDALRDLVGRTLGVREVLRPRPGAAFEPDRLVPTRRPIEAGELEDDRGKPEPQVAAPRGRSRPAAAGEEAATAPRAPAEPAPGRSAGEPSPSAPRDDPVVAAEPEAERPGPPRPRRDPAKEAPPSGTRTARPRHLPAAEPEPEPAERARAAPRGLERAPDAELPQAVEARGAERRRDALEQPPEPVTPPVRGRRARTSDVAARRSEPHDAEPVVHVHIDRIEVRAPVAPEPARAPRPREPTLSLDDYLAGNRSAGR